MKARIYKSGKREFLCRIEETSEEVMAIARGNLLKNDETLVVGDIVNLENSNDSEQWAITSVEPRKNELFRLLVREKRKKITASNCDILVILMSVSRPAYKRGIIDRFLVRAFQWGIQPIVVFNKMDEYQEDKFDIVFERDRLKELGVHCFELSAKFSEYEKKYLDKGITDLKDFLKGTLSVFVGQSGVGKSKTITALSEGKVNLKTKQVGKAGKGSHTTTWSEIIDCDSFSLIDSPGIRSFSLDDMDPDELLAHFPDLADRASTCQFRNCEHEASSKGCAFYQEDQDEDSKKRILSRLESYKRLKSEMSATPQWKKK